MPVKCCTKVIVCKRKIACKFTLRPTTQNKTKRNEMKIGNHLNTYPKCSEQVKLNSIDNYTV